MRQSKVKYAIRKIDACIDCIYIFHLKRLPDSFHVHYNEMFDVPQLTNKLCEI